MIRHHTTAASPAAIAFGAIAVMVLGAALSALPALSAAPSPNHLLVATSANELLRFNAARPQRVLDRRPIDGLADQETLVGLAYAGTPRQLHARGSSGRIYRLELTPQTALALPAAPGLATAGTRLERQPDPRATGIRINPPDTLDLVLHPDLNRPDIGRVTSANFAIAAHNGDAYLTTTVGERWQLFQVDLERGEANAVGTLATYDPVHALTVEP